MARHEGAMYSSCSVEAEDDDALATDIDQEDCARKSSSGKSVLSRQVFRRMHRSDLRAMFDKGKQGFQTIQEKYSIENIPLPLVKQDIQPGQEWIRGAMVCALGTASIGVLNVILTIIAVGIAYSKEASDKRFSYGELYEGDCSVTSSWTTGMHLVINVLSSILLAASNYVMQCLSAPSRADVDKAHAKRDWLDIGTLSIRNLWVMDGKRKILWGLLFISSLPIHMLLGYNTAIFSSISTIDYGAVVIPSDLGRNESLVQDAFETQSFHELIGFTPEEILAQRWNGTFRNSSIPDCFKRYNQEFNTEAATLLLVTDRKNLGGSSSVASLGQMSGNQSGWMGKYPESISQSSVNSFQFQLQKWNYPRWSFKNASTSDWADMSDLCPDLYSGQNDEDDYEVCRNDTRTLANFIWNLNPSESRLGDFLNAASNWQNSSWAAQVSFRIDGPTDAEAADRMVDAAYYYYDDTATGSITISGCMTSDAEQHCRLYFSLPICIAVLACNIVKVLCMYMTAKTDHREIFLTVGDALSSFLDKPDATTRRQCFRPGNDEIENTTPGVRRVARTPVQMSIPEETCPELPSRRKRWRQAGSWRRWTFTYILFFACLVVSIFLCYIGSGFALSEARKLGMGKASGSTVLGITQEQDLIVLALLANTPQLVFSTLYLACNGLFTCMLAVAEYNDFATQRKPLRVSWPKGEQRSTYYLSLPYKYSLPLITVSVAMHWLLSQCIFLVKINAFDIHGHPVTYSDYSRAESIEACGFSPLAMFITLIVGAVAMIILFGFSLRPLRSNMPLISSCSTAISAACHPPPVDEDASMKPVMWGELRQDSSDGSVSDSEDRVPDYIHCSFTSTEVVIPSIIRLHRER